MFLRLACGMYVNTEQITAIIVAKQDDHMVIEYITSVTEAERDTRTNVLILALSDGSRVRCSYRVLNTAYAAQRYIMMTVHGEDPGYEFPDPENVRWEER